MPPEPSITPTDPNNPPETLTGGSNPQPTTSEDYYELTVDGKTQSLTIDELKKQAEKGMGADARFREASELRKTAEEGIRTKELIYKLNTGLPLSVVEATELAGYTGAEANDFLNLPPITGDDTMDNNPDNFNNDNNDNNTAISNQAGSMVDPASLARSAEDKQILEQAKQDHYEKVVSTTKEEIKNKVDLDEELSKVIAGKPDIDKEAARKTLFEMVFNEVSRRLVLGRQSYGPELVKASLQTVKVFIKQFGTPASITGNPLKEDNPPILGLGPSGGLSTSEIAAGKKLERVASGESGYADNFARRLAERILRSRNKE